MTDDYTDACQGCFDMTQTLAYPFAWPTGVASGICLDDLRHRLLNTVYFFSSRLRPPPLTRMPSTGRPAKPFSNSVRPLRIVLISSPVILCTASVPPYPKRLASTPASQRRCCSSRRLISRFSWLCCDCMRVSPPWHAAQVHS